MKKEYTCICGRTFDNPQSFNGHKSHCVLHLESTGRLALRKNIDSERAKKLSDKIKNKYKTKFKQETDKWISEKHTCEKCGKVMTEKFGSGRFCSRSCANSRDHNKETKAKISQSVKLFTSKDNYKNHNTIKSQEKYNLNPNKCVICGNVLPYDMRNRLTCSKKCFTKRLSQKSIESVIKHGGNINIKGVRGTAKFGTYKGIHCDSSYELAFVIYCLDHNINIKRCDMSFKYIISGVEHLYFPDFIINDTIIEIKNYSTKIVEEKINQLPKDINFRILFKSDLSNVFDYVNKTYGENYITLYDQKYPCWMKNK